MKKYLLISIIGVVMFSTACQQDTKKPFNLEEHKAVISLLDSQYKHHIKSQHADSLMTIYKAEAVLLTPGEAEISGHTDIKNWYSSAFEYGLRSCDFTKSNFIGDENYIIENGHSRIGLQIGEADTLIYESYKYLHVWEKQENGKYKLVRDIWNADRAEIVE
jgi:ketosteroid isomerase-like protein